MSNYCHIIFPIAAVLNFSIFLKSPKRFLYSLLKWLKVLVSHIWLFATPWTVSCQPPLSMEFSRQEYRNGLPFPSPGVFPTQGSNPRLLHCRWILHHLSHQRSPSIYLLGKSRTSDLRPLTFTFFYFTIALLVLSISSPFILL